MTDLSLPIVLIGMPGAGKSKVGQLLAQSLGVVHADLDAIIEAEHEASVAQLFESRGEAFFRSEEHRLLGDLLEAGGVISLGGGAITQAPVRELLRGYSTVYIDVEHDELLRRTSGKTHRPLLANDPDAALKRLRAERDGIYREAATHIVTSDDSPVETVVEKIRAFMPAVPTAIAVTGDDNYDVVIGDVLSRAWIRTALRPTCTKVLLIHAEAVGGIADRVRREVEALGIEVTSVTHPDAEAAKTADVMVEMWAHAGEAKLGRHDAIISVGGGATTDMAGFVAATWLRGIDVIHVPTTLLAMVDAAVGGKTGINTPTGKNLVGSFHPPKRVLVSPAVLITLPVADIRAGAAEIIKAGFIDDGEILRLFDEEADTVFTPGSPANREVIERAVSVKARIVSQDLKEAGLREFLNYGHTLAHAIETVENYTWRHGDAVAVGCVFAAELGRSLGYLTDDEVARHRTVLSAVGLPTSYSGADFNTLLEVMGSDKKVRAGSLRFVILDGIGNPKTVQVHADQLRDAATAVGISL